MDPQILVEQAAVTRGPTPEHWLVAWRIQNLSSEPLEILAGRLPHGKFRGDEKEFTPSPKIARGEDIRLEFSVACHEPAGAEVENAFLILRVVWGGRPWRILARLRVKLSAGGEPESVTELITTQQIGFSQREQEG